MTDLELLAYQNAQAKNLDPLLVRRLIRQESAWNPNAQSPVGARGLMQIMPATGRELGLTSIGDLLDPQKNVAAGTTYLSRLFKRFGGDPHLATMAYNAGPGRVSRLMSAHGASPEAIFPHLPAETRNYTLKVAGPLSGLPAPNLLSSHQTPPPALPPIRQQSIQNASPEGLAERIYRYVFGAENEGLPEPKAWPGPELGLPPPQLTTGDLATFGTLGLTGMGAAMPVLARAAPLSLSSPVRMATEIGLGIGGEAAGREVGEAVGGETGANVGAGLGGLLSLPSRAAAPTAGIVGVPPTGPLRGTAVLTREGLAKPMVHGTRVAYQDPDLSQAKPGLFGTGHYFTSELQNVPTGYSGIAPVLKTQKALSSITREDQKYMKRLLGLRARVNQLLDPEEKFMLAELQEQYGDEATALRRLREQLVNRSASPEKLRALAQYDRVGSERTIVRAKVNQMRDKIAEVSGSAPNTRLAYLNIKHPFNMDKPLTAEAYDSIGAALNAHPLKFDPSIQDLVEEVRSAATRMTPNEKGRPGEFLYQRMADLLGSQDEANRVLRNAGYDGITHLGGGRFRGGPHKPVTHRVHIAFHDDQVIPYFSPEFSEEQAKRELVKKQTRQGKWP